MPKYIGTDFSILDQGKTGSVLFLEDTKKKKNAER